MSSADPTWRGTSSSRAQTIAIGRAVGERCRAGDLIALIGELGAGKTQFTQGLAAGLGIDAAVASPTFVMVQEYVREQPASRDGNAPPPLPPRERVAESARPGEGRAHKFSGTTNSTANSQQQSPHASASSDPHPSPLPGRERGPEPAQAQSPALRLIHIDAYRIHKLDELESIGWEITGDTLGGEMRHGSVVAIEWADRLDELVGSDRLEVKLAHLGDDQRSVHITAHGSWAGRAKGLFEAITNLLNPNDPQASTSSHTPNPKPQTPAPSPSPSPCPICKKPVLKSEPTFPFCSKRCKTIDLGKWLSGNYVISRPVEQSELEEE